MKTKLAQTLLIALLFHSLLGAQGLNRLPPKIGYKALSDLMSSAGSRLLILDVRTKEEFQAGRIPGAVLAPYDLLARDFKETDKNRPIVVYCRSGRRSSIARETLLSMGYTNVADFGGIDAWLGKTLKQ